MKKGGTRGIEMKGEARNFHPPHSLEVLYVPKVLRRRTNPKCPVMLTQPQDGYTRYLMQITRPALHLNSWAFYTAHAVAKIPAAKFALPQLLGLSTSSLAERQFRVSASARNGSETRLIRHSSPFSRGVSWPGKDWLECSLSLLQTLIDTHTARYVHCRS